MEGDGARETPTVIPAPDQVGGRPGGDPVAEGRAPSGAGVGYWFPFPRASPSPGMTGVASAAGRPRARARDRAG